MDMVLVEAQDPVHARGRRHLSPDWRELLLVRFGDERGRSLGAASI
jgi:hypothetical protein